MNIQVFNECIAGYGTKLKLEIKRRITMILTKKTIQIKKASIGGENYTRFISIVPTDIEDMKNQITQAAAIDEAGIEIILGGYWIDTWINSDS